jgi:hypothetical protein
VRAVLRPARRATVKPARFCSCENPVRATTAEGADFCEICEELLPTSQDVLLATLTRAVARMSRQLDALTAGTGGDGGAANGQSAESTARVTDFPPRNGQAELALPRLQAAKAVGMGPTSFDKYVRPHVRAVRRGSLRCYPVAELERWLDENAELALAGDHEKG